MKMKKIIITLLSFSFVFLQEFDEKLLFVVRKNRKENCEENKQFLLTIGLKTISILLLS